MNADGTYSFGILKRNMPVDQRVMFGQTADPDLDGTTGTVLGKSGDHVFDVYIVLLDKPYMGQKAINITEACLSPL